MHAPTRPEIAIVAALSRNDVIGRGNRLPWHLPADLAHFKRLTLDHVLVMGRRTWESLPGPLPRRRHLVLSRRPLGSTDGCEQVRSPEDAIAAAADASELMVVGGAEVYRLFLPLATRMYLTRVEAEIDGDVRFPRWQPDVWRLVDAQTRPHDERNPYDLRFMTWERIRPDADRPPR
jgi:dihydrofolate reductase